MDEFANTANRIKGYLDDLQEFSGSDFSEKKDYYAASMLVFSAINESFRIAEIFMAKKAYAAPATYKEMFDVLLSRKAIAPRTAQLMKMLVQKRNLIAHEYGELKPSDMKGILQSLPSIRSFMSELAKKY